MKQKFIKLLPESSNVRVKNDTNNDSTTIFYNSPVWPDRDCIILIPGVWRIKDTEDDILTLENEDEVIPIRHEVQE